MATQVERFALAALAIFIAVSAAAGAVGLVAGGLAFPPEWIEGTLFSNYVGPGLILGVVVGGSALAAAAMTVRRHPQAVSAAFGAGIIQMGWIAGEVLLVGTHGTVMLWLQVIYGFAGTLLAVIALDASRRTRRSANRAVSGASA